MTKHGNIQHLNFRKTAKPNTFVHVGHYISFIKMLFINTLCWIFLINLLTKIQKHPMDKDNQGAIFWLAWQLITEIHISNVSMDPSELDFVALIQSNSRVKKD